MGLPLPRLLWGSVAKPPFSSPFIDISMKKEEKSKICLRRKRVDKKKRKKRLSREKLICNFSVYITLF